VSWDLAVVAKSDDSSVSDELPIVAMAGAQNLQMLDHILPPSFVVFR
jgi:hypothetical protein